MPEDLWTLMTSGAFKPGGSENPKPSKRQKELRRKERRAEAYRRDMAEKEALLHKAVEEMSMWAPQALVQVVFSTTCSCGETSLHPEIYPQSLVVKPLVRFKHKRDFRLWEKRIDWKDLPPGLPREIRTLHAHSLCCPVCLERKKDLSDPRQLSFAFYGA